MTVQELRQSLHDQYGMNTKWPDKLFVDADTYANVCQAIFINAVEDPDRCILKAGGYYFIDNISLGPHKGIMYKEVELILRTNEHRPTKETDKTCE